jgi:hypothetical protein
MGFPFGIWDLSLLTAMLSIILLVTVGVLFSQSDKVNLLISIRNLRNAAMTLTILFLVTVFLRILSLV